LGRKENELAQQGETVNPKPLVKGVVTIVF